MRDAIILEIGTALVTSKIEPFLPVRAGCRLKPWKVVPGCQLRRISVDHSAEIARGGVGVYRTAFFGRARGLLLQSCTCCSPCAASTTFFSYCRTYGFYLDVPRMLDNANDIIGFVVET